MFKRSLLVKKFPSHLDKTRGKLSMTETMINPFAHAATSNVNSADNYTHKEVQGAHIKSSQRV